MEASLSKNSKMIQKETSLKTPNNTTDGMLKKAWIIEDGNKEFYIRGIKEYQTNSEKGYLIDICKNSQDNYEKMVNYFLEDNNY